MLRRPRLEDARDLLEYVRDPEVMRWIGGEPGDLEATVATIERWLGRWEANGIGYFALERDGRVVGRVGFNVWDAAVWRVAQLAEAKVPAVELAWTIARAHWGHGYATEAARALRPWAYAHGVESLISLINPDNARSIRVAEKLDATPTETVEIEGEPAVVWRHPAQPLS